MTRFFLSSDAKEDLEDIRAYHRGLPPGPAHRIKSHLQKTIFDIARHPYVGTAEGRLATLFEVEIRSRLAYPYRIYYRLNSAHPEIIAILHGARDHAAILAGRLP